MSTETTLLQKPAEDFLKEKGVLYTKKNWNNKNRQGDEGKVDISAYMPRGIVLNVEFKTPEKFKLPDHNRSDNQMKWANYLIDNGHKYYCTDSLDFFKSLVLSFM